MLTPFNMASGFTRKNPVAAVRAFKLAFDDGAADARLILKTHHVSAYAAGCEELAAVIDGDPRITLLDRTLDRSELDALIAGCDALMLLHRSEGFGLPLAEAMGQGLPVVATNWSGNTDFMNFDNSCPVSYCLVPARDPQGSYDHADQLWAEPSAANAAMHLRRLRENPAFGAELGGGEPHDPGALFAEGVCRTLGRAADGRCRLVLKASPGMRTERVSGRRKRCAAL